MSEPATELGTDHPIRIGERLANATLDQLRETRSPIADDTPNFNSNAWREIKQANKIRSGRLDVRKSTGVDRWIPHSRVRRAQCQADLHEYKRQLSERRCTSSPWLYQRVKADPRRRNLVPRTVILFGAKSAPGYYMAKRIIKLIHSRGATWSTRMPTGGRAIEGRLLSANFNVKNMAEKIYPGADISEQISMAGKEASGTGNMKFSLNGALTIGTLDGANIEIREEVGEENFFLFGLTTEQVSETRAEGYTPWEFYRANPELKAAIDMIDSGFFSPPGQPNLFKPLVGALLHHDEYMLLADYQSYVECQERVSGVYQDQQAWTRMAILNVARMGKFSSDRAVRDYCRNIWHVETKGDN